MFKYPQTADAKKNYITKAEKKAGKQNQQIMKKVKLISVAALALLLTAVMFFSCKEDEAEDPNLTYIKDFYGVNVVHSFVCLNPTNDTKSLQVDLVWDEKGVATYTTTDIPRDTASEHNSRIFMPASEFNATDGTITPTKSVKTFMLILDGGTIEPVDNYNCNGVWAWTCSFCNPAAGGIVITQGSNMWVECRVFPTIPLNPTCHAHWYCSSTGKETEIIIGWQSL